VELDGTFQVNWSDPVFQVLKASVVSKNAVQIKVIWNNEEILTGMEPKPVYQAKVVDVSEQNISFQLLFAKPELISQGNLPDIV
jgi:hypothetical protein